MRHSYVGNEHGNSRPHALLSSPLPLPLLLLLPPRSFVTRVCLGVAGTAYENRYMTFPELLAARGPSGFSDAVPLGQLPLLTLPSGQVVTQSGAHLRYAARKAGLYAADDEKALLVDEILDTVVDFMAKVPQHPDSEQKKALREAWVKDVAPKYLSFFARKLSASAGPFLFGADLNVADLQLMTALNGMCVCGGARCGERFAAAALL